MSHEGDEAEHPLPGTIERARDFAARARRAPGRVDELARAVQASGAELTSGLGEVRAALAHLERLAWDGRSDTRAGVEAVGAELHRLRAHVDVVGESVTALDGALASHAAAIRRAVEAPARHAAARRLRDALGPAPELRPGLSVFTLCWNHGELLDASVRSAQATLDLLGTDDQGEILIIDDASTDSTPRVATALAATDERIRVVRSEENLGLGHARNVLLHAARTTHALQLDADNVAVPGGVLDLYRVSRRTGAAVTFGTVAQIRTDGTPLGVLSNEPPTAAFFRSNYIDTHAVTDVAALRGLGGWSTDPLLEHVDDWAALHHTIAAGLLLAFVPTLAGVYGEHPTGFHHSVPDPRLGQQRIGRVFDPTGRHQGADPLADVAAVAVHPTVGPLWATPAAVDLDPSLAPAAPTPVRVAEPAARVLLVAPGGVANLGDDAITERAVARARTALGPHVAIDVVSDGTPTRAVGHRARWLAPLTLVLHGLRADEVGSDDGPLAVAADRAAVGSGRWRPCDPATYDAAVFLGCGLSSHWVDGTIAPRALLAAALRAAGVPYACSGQGYAVSGDEAVALVDRFVGGAEVVGCRDQESAEFAASLPSVDPARVAVTGDDALGLEPSGDGVSITGPAAGVLAVTVRRAGYVGPVSGDADQSVSDTVRRWALAADSLAVERGWEVLGVALNSQGPEPEIATLAALRSTTPLRARWRLLECGDDPARLVAAMGGATAVAAQSYHAALFGLAAGVPAVLGAATPYYVAKAGGLAALAGLPPALAVADPADLGAGLDAVAGALRGQPRPLAAATEAADAWWSAVPEALGVVAPA